MQYTELDKYDTANQACEVRSRNLLETLSQDLIRARANVQRLEELINLLDKNPEVNRIMELLGGKY